MSISHPPPQKQPQGPLGTPDAGRPERIARADRARAQQYRQAAYREYHEPRRPEVIYLQPEGDRTDLADLHARLAQAEKIIQDQGAQLADVVEAVRILLERGKQP